ncbi:hypothetical protein AH332_10475 [Salmonella enterica subsp. salamae]|nr:hypothetical protein [Salmonella enterica subsp. salamae]EDW4020702.1 hypothetical protein [Salmonella enterica subsp. salamae]
MRNALLFFERDTKTIIPDKKMPGLHQAFQQTGAIAKNGNNSLSFLSKIRTECRRQNPLAVR